MTAARINMPNVLARKRKMVEAEVAFHRQKYRETDVELIMGEARFVAPKTVEVNLNGGGTRRLSADKVFLNLGTRPSVPPIPGLADTAMTNIELLELDRVPEHMIVLGGGYVGLEFAQAYRRFGSRITVVARGPQLLDREDPDVAAAMLRLFTDDGIEVLLGAETLRVDGRKGDLRVVVRARDGERAIAASDLLAAVGRTPNTGGIGLELAGVDARFARLHHRQRPAGNHRTGTCGRSVSAPAARNSRMCRSMTFASFATTSSPESRGRLVAGWFPPACSPIRSSRVWA